MLDVTLAGSTLLRSSKHKTLSPLYRCIHHVFTNTPALVALEQVDLCSLTSEILQRQHEAAAFSGGPDVPVANVRMYRHAFDA